MIVAICDDEEIFCQELKKFLIRYKKCRQIHLDIVEFSNGQSVLNYDRGFDVVFLDYEIPGLDGIKTARTLRSRKTFVALCI